jgi:membrane protein
MFKQFYQKFPSTWEIIRKYFKDDCLSYAAGLSFWIIISIVPLSTLMFKLLEQILGVKVYTEATQKMLEQMIPFLPANFVKNSIHNSQQLSGTIFSWGVLLFGGYWAVSQLDTSLTHVFGLGKPTRNPLLRQITLLIGGMILMVVLMVILIGGIFKKYFPFISQTDLHIPFFFPPMLYFIGMMIVMMYLPRFYVKFRHAFLGSIVSTFLWWMAKYIFAIYLAHALTWGIMYGSLISMIIALTFLYYSCAIFLFGVEVTASFYKPGKTLLKNKF